MLWWEGWGGGEWHHARHHTSASTDQAGSWEGQRRRGLPTVNCEAGREGVPDTALPTHQQ